ncbi:MAG: hypothetical protein VX871_07090, partial [Pseudomonadota bacterium]|nr:hypothetical protein [Pseudomonadota bacterium]
SRLRQELSDLRQGEAEETALLRSELQRLADMMMAAPLPERVTEMQEQVADMAAAKETPERDVESGKSRSGGKRKRLRDRLKVLRAKEKANA